VSNAYPNSKSGPPNRGCPVVVRSDRDAHDYLWTVGEFTSSKTFAYVNSDTVATTDKKQHQLTTITPMAELESIVKSGKTYAKGTPIVNYTSLMAGKGIAEGDVIKAYLSISATSDGGVTNIGNSLSQSFDGTVKLTDVANHKNILTATFVGGSLIAKLNANSFTFDANSTAPGTLTFTSDFYDNLGMINDFALGGSGLSAPISYKPGHSLNYKGGYQSDITGTLSTVPVAEPGAVAMLGLGLAGLSFARRRRAIKTITS